MEWQPIEAAPKDGTMIDLWSGKRFPEAYWGCPWDADKGYYSWCVWGYIYNRGWCSCEIERVTHWMPIPEGPKD